MSSATTRRRQIFTKDPQSTLDFNIEWRNWLKGDVITTSSWIVPAGITMMASSHTVRGLTTIFLADGVIGTQYEIINEITTALGRTEQRSFFVKIVDL